MQSFLHQGIKSLGSVIGVIVEIYALNTIGKYLIKISFNPKTSF